MMNEIKLTVVAFFSSSASGAGTLKWDNILYY